MDPTQIFYSTDKMKILSYASAIHSLVLSTALDFIWRKMNALSVKQGFKLQMGNV